MVRSDKKLMANYTNLVTGRIGYIINTAYNLSVSAGFTHRRQNFYNFSAMSNETNYFFLTLRTGINNLYFDF
jgi:hypothetical protein